jgi:hypothetical protein
VYKLMDNDDGGGRTASWMEPTLYKPKPDVSNQMENGSGGGGDRIASHPKHTMSKLMDNDDGGG